MKAFLDTSNGTPYCKGCGHPHVLEALDAALQTADVLPHRIALVTDIGCVGLADAQFPELHTVHALHGRAAALAAGMQLAGTVTEDGPLKPIVLVGDGGATIGLLHLVHAAQLDVDVTVIVHNNLIYGMTGGQHSGFTPQGLRTTTTPHGVGIPPLDLAHVLGGAGCGYFARTRAPGRDLATLVAEGIRRPGFACIEALELCPTFAARIGGVTGKTLTAMGAEGGLAMGVIHDRPPRVAPTRDSSGVAPEDLFGKRLEPRPAWSGLQETVRILLAGRAGERAQSAAKFVATAAATAGLGATLRTDNPVTQGKGFSLAELILSPTQVRYTGLEQADLAIVTAQEGLTQLTQRDLLEGPSAPRRLLIDARLDLPAGTRCESAPLRERFGPLACSLGALVEIVHQAGWLDDRALWAAWKQLPEAQQPGTRRVLEKAGLSAPPDAVQRSA